MNEAYKDIIAASDGDRRNLFLETAARLGTAVQNVEKDFWVCWVLDALFNGMSTNGPRLLFKGGTSLSKAFGLISRFSEDIDITVFRDDIGQHAEPEELELLSGKQRRKRLDAIRTACQAFIRGDLTAQLQALANEFIPQGFRLEPDPDDRDGQTLLLWYPAVTAASGQYIRSAVKIEAGAKSALDPHAAAMVTPYVAADVPHLNLDVAEVTTVQPERTFWDKIVIVHGLCQWYERRGELRHGGQRISRHFYDVHQLALSTHATDWLRNQPLAEDCARHARLFFGSADFVLELARAGTYTLSPPEAMRDGLRRDYEAMAGMIFHGTPSLDEVLATVEQVERQING
ncbi:nucleotidyl transferase AbiEii/AbiGii toxin family protein [Paraburkholderia hospita]|jgi:hypothetical protein|uniref:nucleotidyl transferase AbiEii/AbiGii toxin family protein n=1 Tax=Paraburkholderia hospita TaxID=169430 RepID=UPI003ED10529